METQFSRRGFLVGSVAAAASAGLAGCLPAIGPRRRSVVNVGLITFPGGMGGFRPSSISLYKAALAVTKAHGDELEVNVNTITVTPPTPGPPPGKPNAGTLPRLSEPPTVSALEQALGQDPPPDVVLFDQGVEFGFALQKNLLQPIDTYLRSEGVLKDSDYFPGALKAASDQGQLYGLPLAVQPTVLQYDRRLFDAAHLDPPDGSWTWTTFLNAARALTRPEGENGGQFGVNLLNTGNVVPIFIWQNGGDLLSPDGRRSLLNEAAQIEAIKFLYDLVNTYKVAAVPPKPGTNTPGVAWGKPIVAGQPGSYPPLFGPGGQRVAMTFVSMGPFYGFGPFAQGGERPIRLAEVPRGKEQATAMDLSGILAVTQRAADPRAAFRVAALLAQEMEKDLMVPARRPSPASLTRSNPTLSEDDAKVLIASLEYARAIPVLAAPIIAPLVYQKILQPIQEGQKTPAEIAREAAETIDQALNQ